VSALYATDIVVRRSGRAIVDHASFTLQPGSFVAVVGANGAGKSTLLSVLAGLLKPDAGKVLIDDVELANIDRRELAKRRGYLPQSLLAEWPISVERLVALGLTPHLPAFGGLRGGVEPRLTKAIEDFDLIPQRFQPATTLSGGELTRAMLARALIGEPQIVIVDEPIAGLDPKHALDTVHRLRQLAAGGKLVIASLHELTMAARYSTHLMAMVNGKVVAFGPTAEVLNIDLLRQVFDVEGCINGEGANTFVDFGAPAREAEQAPLGF
jgi:iron complex transport system ATP-binding protein